MKFLSAILSLMLLFLPVLCAADSVQLTLDREATLFWPEGTGADDAVYTYHYLLPRAGGEDPVAEGINAFYEYMESDTVDFTLPIGGESLSDPTLPARTDVTASITCQTDSYVSILMETRSFLDGEHYLNYSAQVFAKQGNKQGLVISLPYLLGTLSDSEADTWLQDRQTQKADACVRRLIWEEIEASEMDLLPDVTFDFFSAMFYPEEDFYLLDDHTLVFFVQPGILTDQTDAPALFELDLDLILDEI
ncbi:MAG: hypothetical protein IJ083_16395 [Clostridia bacterium]|nr:hypothetical protein [Clostridia bacterium]